MKVHVVYVLLVVVVRLIWITLWNNASGYVLAARVSENHSGLTLVVIAVDTESTSLVRVSNLILFGGADSSNAIEVATAVLVVVIAKVKSDFFATGPGVKLVVEIVQEVVFDF